jgi:putative membrane protein
MRPVQQFLPLIATAVLVVASASAQTSDPYNPQTRRIPAQNGSQDIQPSLATMGAGFDEGNIGPFVTMGDKQYARAMAARGIMEIRLGQVAMDKAERPEVKAVAQRMIKDYLNWNDGMTKAAARLKFELPSDIDNKQKADFERISALSGSAFDRAYLKEVIQLQTRALTMSHHEAEEASVSGFRHWAGITVPNLQDQIQMARKALESETAVSRK